MATVTNTVILPDGSIPARVDVVIELVASTSGKAAGWITATDATLEATVRPLVVNGAWTASLTPNADITPSGSVYRITEYVDKSRYIHYIEVGDDGGSVLDLLTDPPSAVEPSALSAHKNQATGAHAASAISVLDAAGYYAATDAESALAEAGGLIAGLQPLSGSTISCPRFAAIGDSITANGGMSGLAVHKNVSETCWHMFAQILADSRALYVGRFATSGYTTAQVLATHVPQLLAMSPRPDLCVVLTGQNNIGSQFSEYETTLQTIIAAGIKPVVCTLTPSSSSATLLGHNAFIRRMAAKYNVPLVDLYGSTVDNSTGTWVSSYTSDGVHPTQAGAWVMGQALADVLADIVPSNVWDSWLPRTGLGTAASTGSSAALFISGPTGTLPTSWSALTGGHAGSPTYASGSAGFGYKMSIVRSGSDISYRNTCSASVSPGERFVLCFKLSTSLVSQGSSIRMAFGIPSSGSPAYVLDFGYFNTQNFKYDLNDKTCVFELTAPTSWASTTTWRNDFIVVGGSGSPSLTLERFALWQFGMLGVPEGV